MCVQLNPFCPHKSEQTNLRCRPQPRREDCNNVRQEDWNPRIPVGISPVSKQSSLLSLYNPTATLAYTIAYSNIMLETVQIPLIVFCCAKAHVTVYVESVYISHLADSDQHAVKLDQHVTLTHDTHSGYCHTVKRPTGAKLQPILFPR